MPDNTDQTEAAVTTSKTESTQPGLKQLANRSGPEPEAASARRWNPPLPDSIERTETAGAATDTAFTPPAVMPEVGNELSRRDVLRYGVLGAAGAVLGLSRLGADLRGAARFVAHDGAGRRTFAAAKPISLTVWVWAGASVSQAGYNAVQKTYRKALGNVNLDIKTFTGGDAGNAEKFSLALSGHTTLPDILYLNYIEVPEFANKGVLINLDSYFKPVASDLYAGAQTVAQVNGQYVTFPIQLNGKIYYYRQDLFESAGIDVSSIPNMTTAEFIQMGKTFTAKHPGQYIMNMANEPPEYLFGEMISAYAPISFASQTGKYDVISNPAFGDVLSFMRDIRKSGIAYPVDDFTTDWPSAIKAEKICGFLIADWMDQFLPSYATLSASGKWKALPWPSLKPLANQQYGSDAGGAVAVIPAAAPNATLAAEVCNYWHLQGAGALAAFGANGVLPILKSVEPGVLSSLSSAKKPSSMSQTDWEELPQNYFGGASYIKSKLAAQDRVKVFGFDPKALVDWNTIMVNWMEKVLEGKVSVSAALAGMQKDMKTEVGNPWSSS